jgi:hypothetical protein
MYIPSLFQLFMINAVRTASFDPKFAQDGGISNAIPIDISCLYNSRAFAVGPNDANMDGLGGMYPSIGSLVAC